MSVVMPFAGDAGDRAQALATLDSIRVGPGDELLFVDNSENADAAAPLPQGVLGVRASELQSSYHARNEGALRATADWILFVDSDCVLPIDVLDAFFAAEVGDAVGVLAPSIAGARGEPSLTARWATERRILEPSLFLERARPAAPTACLLVRRAAWAAVGGFLEVRSGGDLDFCWRLQDAGWELEQRAAVVVEHRQRKTVGAAARQFRRYAAGNEWQRRRGVIDSRPGRPLRNLLRAPLGAAFYLLTLRGTQARFRILDGVAAASQIAGRLQGNAPSRPDRGRRGRRLVVATDIFPAVSETFIREEIGALRRAGWDIRVEAVARPERPVLRLEESIRADYVEDAGAIEKARALAWLAARHPLRAFADLWRRRRYAPQERMPLRAIAPAARRLAGEGDEHVHVHFAALAAANSLRAGHLLGVPVSVTAHAREVYVEPLSLEQKLGDAAFVVATSEYVARDLRKLAPRAAERITVMAMGVDCSAFRRTEPHPNVGRVVAVGRLVEKKGFGDLVLAAAAVRRELPSAMFTIAGEGPLEATLRRQIDELDLAAGVTLAPVRSRAEVAALLQRADVFALPCVVAADGDRDSMPVAIKEALAAEVPVVGTDEVGIPEVVQPAWGALVAPHDPAALAQALLDLLRRDPGERAAMGAAGREFVCERFTTAAQATRLTELISGRG